MLLVTGQRKKAKANCAALWQMHLSAASPFSLDWDMELQAVPFGQRFQIVPPKSDASALTEMAKKKGEGSFQFRTRHSTVQLTQSITNSKKLGQTTR